MSSSGKNNRIRPKVLLPLTLTLVFFLALFICTSYFYLQKNISRELEQQYRTADILLNELVIQRTELMESAIRQITEDRNLQNLMRGGRREELLKIAHPISEILTSRHNITHFYFHTPEGLNYLRLHQPGRHGDLITRFTFKRAKQNLTAASGIELGPLGTISLRLVVPWFADGNLIGFIELGEEIEYLFRKLQDVAPFEVTVFLRKSLLEQKLWEEGMRMLGRAPKWGLFPDRVVSFGNFQGISPTLAQTLARQGFWSKKAVVLSIGGRHFRGRLLPLNDVTGRRLGEFLILRDITIILKEFGHSMMLVVAFCLFFGGSLFASAFFLLGRTDRQLDLTRRQLVEEFDRARMVNRQLEQEIGERRQAETALKENRDMLEIRVRERTEELDLQNKLLTSLIHHIPFHVYWKDPGLYYQGCNAGFAVMMGMEDDRQILRLTDEDLRWGGEQRRRLHSLEQTVSQTGEPVVNQEFIMTAAGQETFYLYSLVPLKDAAGKLTGLLGLFEDITERKRSELALRRALGEARQARDRLSTVMRSVDDILFAVNADNRLLLLNPSAERFLGRRAKEGMGRSIEAAIPHPELLKKVEQALAGQQPGHFDLEIGGTPEAPRILQARTSVLASAEAGFEGMIFLLQDVTQERTMDRLKSDFISTAAHELRTPMAVILGYSELLLHNPDLALEERQEFLSVLFERADAVSILLDDLLDISRIESGQPIALSRTPVAVQELFGRTLEHYRRSAPDHDFSLELEDGTLPLMVDRGKVWQVVENLISNAVKYTPGGGTVIIHGRRIAEEYQVQVQDEGIGMTPEQLRQVFQKFFRADTSDTAIRGTGLGLNIVKHIIEAHGGKIWLESEPGKGTTVNFTLPCAQSEQFPITVAG